MHIFGIQCRCAYLAVRQVLHHNNPPKMRNRWVPLVLPTIYDFCDRVVVELTWPQCRFVLLPLRLGGRGFRHNFRRSLAVVIERKVYSNLVHPILLGSVWKRLKVRLLSLFCFQISRLPKRVVTMAEANNPTFLSRATLRVDCHNRTIGEYPYDGRHCHKDVPPKVAEHLIKSWT